MTPADEQSTPPAPLAAPTPAAGQAPAAAAIPSAVEGMIETAEQARADHAREIDRQIGQFRAGEVAAARAESRRLLQSALERTDAFAARLRRRAAELSDELERVVADARFQAEASPSAPGGAEADPALLAEVRRRIYRIIGAYATLPEDAAPAAAPNGATENGHAGEAAHPPAHPTANGAATSAPTPSPGRSA